MTRANLFEDADVISAYSRAQAIDDGVLVDLTEWAKETGFTIPVACTEAVWSGYIEPPAKVAGLGQSERGRAHDLLWMLYTTIKRGGSGDRLTVQVIFLQAPRKQVTATFKAICGPGDDAAPVVTIMLPDED